MDLINWAIILGLVAFVVFLYFKAAKLREDWFIPD
jgi:hypothetical protein